MALANDTITMLSGRLDSLITSCSALNSILEEEALALGQMDLLTLNTIAVDREGALETVIAEDAVLRRAISDVSREIGVNHADLLKTGPIAEALSTKREALVEQRRLLAASNARIRARANLGLGFFRSSLGTTDSYGASGLSQELGVGSAKFYRVV